MIFFGILDRLKAKYIFSGALLLLFLLPVLGMALPGGVQHPATPERQTPPDSTPTQAVQKSRRETRREIRRLQREADRPPTAETRTEEEQDSLFDTRIDSIFGAPPLSPIAPADSTAPTGNDSLLRDSLRQDTTQRDTTRKKSFLDDIISGKNQDSLYYDVRNRTVYIYNQGDINYQNMNLKGDFMRVNMDEKIIYAHGKRDTIDGKPTVTNPTFTEGAANPYTMDTITYNIGSKKAKIKGVATQEGDGWLIGNNVKKMDDNTIHIQDGKYTTCDQTDHPHFYLAMTKAKVIPGKKVVTGPAYLVLEDVPIYFPLLPEGFFPLSSGPKSGLLMPTFGEESTKGFYIRDLGYYFTLGEHMDLAIRGGIYTLGSWEASAMSRYMKRYKYNGTLNFNYSNVRVGDKGEPDFLQQNNFQLYWQHTQDPKANPGIDLLRIGRFPYQRLQPLFGYQPERSAPDADKFDDLLFEKLARHTVLPFGQHVRFAELAERNALDRPAERRLQRFDLLPLQTQGGDGQAAMVRKDFAPLHRQVQQQGQRQRVRNLHQGNTPEHAVRLRA